MKFKLSLLTLLMAFVVQFSFAQEKTITGTVSDEDGLPLPGVNVIIKGTTKGTQTDFDGKYSISAESSNVLVFSFVGYQTQELTVANSTTMNVILVAGEQLEEIVVVGYGTTTKEAFTGTAAVVNVEELEAKTVSNVSQALRGEVAGVNVVQGSGAPGRDATIRIRGFGSVNGNRDPLYVVDGAPFASDVSSINPADIESMTILKDAAATSIYGSRGANGVILITTKQGKQGKTRVSVDFKTSVNTQLLPTYETIESPEEYIELSWLSLKNKGTLLGQGDPAGWASSNLYSTNPDDTEAIYSAYNIWDTEGSQLINPATGKFNSGVSRKFTPTKWSDAAFGTGYRTEANVQLSGGSESTRFNVSFGYLDDNGYDVNSSYTRYTTRLNLENKTVEWLTVGTNIGWTGSKYNNATDLNGSTSSGNIFAVTNTTPAIYDIYLRDLDGNLVPDPIFGGNQYDYGGEYGRRAWNNTNGIADAHYDRSLSDGNTLLGNINITIDFTDWLSFETRYSGQYEAIENVSIGNPYYGAVASDGGSLFKTNTTNINQNFLQLLRFNKSFGAHNIEAFIAHESTENEYKNFSGGALKAVLPYSEDLNQYTIPFGRSESYTLGWTLESYFAQLNYNYNNKYYLTGSVRRDGSSRFKNDRWGTFGSVGLGWIISNEDFFSNVSFLDYLKLKGSYGIIGDQGVRLQYGYQRYGIATTPDGSYSFTRDNLLANPDLTWETSYITQVGFESTWFNNTLDLNVDYYIKDTKNLFFTTELYPSEGGWAAYEYNSGKLRNKGLEFEAAVNIFKSKAPGDFTLTFAVNGEILDNEITEMPLKLGSDERNVFLPTNLSKGHGIYDWYMREWAGVDPASGVGLWNLYYDDRNGDGIFNAGDSQISSLTQYMDTNPDANVERTITSNWSDATRKYVGKSAIPKIRGGFRLSAGYKNFNLSTQWGYNIGGYVYDGGYASLMQNGSLIGSNNFHTDIRNSWKEPGDVTNVPRMTAGYNTDVNWSSQSTRFLTKADYLSLNNVNLGYNLPEKFTERMALSKFNIFVSGDNLLMFSARQGLNPSTLISTSNYGTFMPMTTFSVGAKVEF